jgi:hypothetical protein
MTNKDVNCNISVNVTPHQAIEAINNVSGWWATNVTGNTQKLNDVFMVRFGKTFAAVKVVEIIPGKKLVWLITDCDLPLFQNPKEWLNTKLIWEVSSESNKTIVTMTHDGLTPDKSCYEDCKKGWTYYVSESLQKLISIGKGMPGTGIFSYIIINERKYEGLLYFKNDPLPEYPDGFIYADVLETRGERVTKIKSAKEYHGENFDPQSLQGEYFLILENKPIYQSIVPLADILQMK